MPNDLEGSVKRSDTDTSKRKVIKRFLYILGMKVPLGIPLNVEYPIIEHWQRLLRNFLCISEVSSYFSHRFEPFTFLNALI